MSTQPGPDLNLEQLLQSGAAAARAGNRAAARALFRALSREHPDDPRVWVSIAGVSSDPAEQRAALLQALALDPGNAWAQQALAQLDGAASSPRPTTVLPETVAPPTDDLAQPTLPPTTAPPPDDLAQPAPPADEPAQQSPFPLLNVLALLLILLLLGAVGLIIGRNLLASAQTVAAPTTTPELAVIPGEQPTPGLAAPTAAPPATQGPGAAPTLPPAPTADPAQPTAPGATVAPAPTQPAGPSPTISAELPLGQVLEYDSWMATLLRPDYAVTLDGAIGDLQPAGRFVLTVVAVGNNSPNPRVIPPELFALTDSAGGRYQPVLGASTAYLALYGRGERGDQALEDVLDPGSGMRSVPILFDVPPDAPGLRLTMAGSAGTGWPISGGAPAPVGP